MVIMCKEGMTLKGFFSLCVIIPILEMTLDLWIKNHNLWDDNPLKFFFKACHQISLILWTLLWKSNPLAITLSSITKATEEGIVTKTDEFS